MPGASVNYTFQPKPDSLNILAGSGSYVIPSGKFARVSMFATDNATVDINGSTVLTSRSWDAMAANDPTNGNLWVNPATSVSFPAGAARGGLQINTEAQAGAVGSGTGVKVLKNSTASNTSSMCSYVPAGTTITVAAGGVAVIELYSG